MSKTKRRVKHADWWAEGVKLFGKDPKEWLFVCPICGRVTKAREWKDAGAPAAAGFSCIGRWVENTGCDYAGGGLFRSNPVIVEYTDGSEPTEVFDFFHADTDCLV